MVDSKVVERLMLSYREGGDINHVDGKRLPSRASVESVMREIEELCFPGFASDELLSEETLLETTTRRVAHASTGLSQLFTLEFQSRAEPEAAQRATELAHSFLFDLPALRHALALDVNALLDGDPAARSREEVIIAYPGVRAIVAYRVAHVFWNAGATLVARMISEAAHAQTGIDIHPGAQIGESFYIDHGTGIVVGETCVIGAHVKLYQGVSLGAMSVSRRFKHQKRHPTLEDHVTVYAGATILGGDTVVGHHSVVGGNVWLVESVPPFSVVEHNSTMRIGTKGSLTGFDPGI